MRFSVHARSLYSQGLLRVFSKRFRISEVKQTPTEKGCTVLVIFLLLIVIL